MNWISRLLYQKVKSLISYTLKQMVCMFVEQIEGTTKFITVLLMKVGLKMVSVFRFLIHMLSSQRKESMIFGKKFKQVQRINTHSKTHKLLRIVMVEVVIRPNVSNKLFHNPIYLF